jgi:hypothetical protein
MRFLGDVLIRGPHRLPGAPQEDRPKALRLLGLIEAVDQR